jgi:hypothetical protein
MARSCYILAGYDCGQRLSLERREPCANAQPVREASGVAVTPGQGLRIKRLPVPRPRTYQAPAAAPAPAAYRLKSALFRKSVDPWQESNPWNLTVLRVICVTSGCAIASS